MTTFTTSMGALMAQTTLHIEVTGRRRAAVRMRLGVLALRAAAAIMGMGLDIEMRADPAGRRPQVESV